MKNSSACMKRFSMGVNIFSTDHLFIGLIPRREDHVFTSITEKSAAGEFFTHTS